MLPSDNQKLLRIAIKYSCKKDFKPKDLCELAVIKCILDFRIALARKIGTSPNSIVTIALDFHSAFT